MSGRQIPNSLEFMFWEFIIKKIFHFLHKHMHIQPQSRLYSTLLTVSLDTSFFEVTNCPIISSTSFNKIMSKGTQAHIHSLIKLKSIFLSHVIPWLYLPKDNNYVDKKFELDFGKPVTSKNCRNIYNKQSPNQDHPVVHILSSRTWLNASSQLLLITTQLYDKIWILKLKIFCGSFLRGFACRYILNKPAAYSIPQYLVLGTFHVISSQILVMMAITVTFMMAIQSYSQLDYNCRSMSSYVSQDLPMNSKRSNSNFVQVNASKRDFILVSTAEYVVFRFGGYFHFSTDC